MKTSNWMKPVEEVGGINSLIANRLIHEHLFITNSPNLYDLVDIFIHCYREEGTALRVVYEAHFHFVGEKSVIRFGTSWL
ncbi:hypothetical protein STP4a_020 [Salmonella phage STP4-a]|uniref:Uncharacterized protein n=1 Tax=Salmonella phage STP4-a TaxID=1445860 RepID=A0A0B4L9E4_9CAUD|nr:hypothetical protein STP4a_020 [Salmonella phage STP4-a]AHJ86876.1 hypothetical protein STP4a_020 [Salmonella phage STP4-a]UFK27148.1 hypothetical protein LG358_00127 [Escherichia phage UoN_LG358_1]